MIQAAVSSALLMVGRLDCCDSLPADGGQELEEFDIDQRIARGDRLVAYDVITACINELHDLRDRLGDVLLGSESMRRLAALAAQKEAERC